MTLLGFNFHWFLSPFFLYGVCYPAVPAKIKIRLLSFPIVIKLILIKTVYCAGHHADLIEEQRGCFSAIYQQLSDLHSRHLSASEFISDISTIQPIKGSPLCTWTHQANKLITTSISSRLSLPRFCLRLGTIN